MKFVITPRSGSPCLVAWTWTGACAEWTGACAEWTGACAKWTAPAPCAEWTGACAEWTAPCAEWMIFSVGNCWLGENHASADHDRKRNAVGRKHAQLCRMPHTNSPGARKTGTAGPNQCNTHSFTVFFCAKSFDFF